MTCLAHASASCSFTPAFSPPDLDPDSSQHIKTKQQLFNEQKNLSESQITPWSFNRSTHRVQLVFYCFFVVKSLNFIAWKL